MLSDRRSSRYMLTASNNDGVAWDWTKPCYYDTLHYQCDMEVLTEDNNE